MRRIAGLLIVVAAAATACSSGSAPSKPGDGKLAVVAAENFWGSIAAQLGGDRVTVTNVISSPNADPHDYEPTPADSRAIAGARYVVVNGAGYDPWASKLIAADPNGRRVVLTVGDLVGVQAGGNPHRWYSPPDVMKVIDRITADYERLLPSAVAYFDERKSAFTTTALARYNSLIADIKAKYAGTPVGASESVFSPMADALGLRLITPPSFLTAISEGNEPTAADKAAIDAQIKNHAIAVYVFNSQNATPDVQRQVAAATDAGIRIVPVSETPTPANASFQDWQSAQLATLEVALARAAQR